MSDRANSSLIAAVVENSTSASPTWWETMDAVDALAHIANALHSLLYGVEDEETLEECQNAADVWMRDVVGIVRKHRV